MEDLHRSMGKINDIMHDKYHLPEEIRACYNRVSGSEIEICFIYVISDANALIGYSWDTYYKMHHGVRGYAFQKGIIISKLKKLQEFTIGIFNGGFAGIIDTSLEEIERQIQKLQLMLLTNV
tara:strand:- start:638 stop:1003 length:366 start_codon:yes stop_codon:yes gene_type:complete